jgi:FtsP/CotA-like multicopper oxidase with cupredoxin domain
MPTHTSLHAGLSRRRFLKAGLASAGAATLAGCAMQPAVQQIALPTAQAHDAASEHLPGADKPDAPGQYLGEHNGHNSLTVGTVDPERNGFDPLKVLVEFDTGKVSTLPSGQTLREYTVYTEDKEIEIAPGVFFPAWTYNGRVPGPTLRCTEGDRIRVELINGSAHPHSIHFHGVHPVEMDGVTGEPSGDVQPGETFIYEFDAEPYGILPYHCHVAPIKRHIHKGLYGMLIVDPKEGRPPAREFAMVMNAFDTNFDGGNEVYAVNSVAFEYARRPIPVKQGELVRIYLANFVEFDLLNTFHLHANVFDYYDHGTTLEPQLRRVDNIIQVQGSRGIVEFRPKHVGKPMFHAHVSEFTELGWMGHFNVVKPEDFVAAVHSVGMNEHWDYLALNSSTSVRA